MIRKLASLGRTRRRALFGAGLMVPAVRLRLRFYSLARVLEWVEKTTPSGPDGVGPTDIAWSVTAVGKRLRIDGPCLTLALAATRMLKKRSIDSTLRIGIMKDAEGALKAHAWVEVDDRVIVGDLDDLSIYTPFAYLDRGRR